MVKGCYGKVFKKDLNPSDNFTSETLHWKLTLGFSTNNCVVRWLNMFLFNLSFLWHSFFWQIKVLSTWFLSWETWVIFFFFNFLIHLPYSINHCVLLTPVPKAVVYPIHFSHALCYYLSSAYHHLSPKLPPQNPNCFHWFQGSFLQSFLHTLARVFYAAGWFWRAFKSFIGFSWPSG